MVDAVEESNPIDDENPYVRAPMGWLISTRRQGASHIARGTICQDAFAYDISGEAGLVLGIADGHGGERYDRSDVGARMAVETSVAALKKLWQEHGGSSEALLEIFGRAFFAEFIKAWRAAVLADDSVQAAGIPHVGVQLTADKIIERYGATLIVALLTDEFCLIGRIGDGDALLLNVPSCQDLFLPDPTLFGTTTHSLCAAEPALNWHVKLVPAAPGDVLLLATDGLSDAFASRQDFLTYGQDVVQRLEQFGLGPIAKKLPEWLDQCSREGSGDDITLLLAAAHPVKTNVEKIASLDPEGG